MMAELKRRAGLAEAGRWDTLAIEYLHERQMQNFSHESKSEDRGLVADRVEALEAAVRKALGGCMRAAAQLLRGDARVPGTRETKEALQQLVAMDVPPEEKSAIAIACERARQLEDQLPPIKPRTIRRKLRVLKRAAGPGQRLAQWLPADDRPSPGGHLSANRLGASIHCRPDDVGRGFALG